MSSRKNQVLILVVFQGCPKIKKAKKALNEIGLEFKVVFQDNLSEFDELRKYTSPSILLGKSLIYGSVTDDNASGCSVEILTSDLIQKRITDSND